MSFLVTSIVQILVITSWFLAASTVAAKGSLVFDFDPNEVVILPARYETKVFKMIIPEDEDENAEENTDQSNQKHHFQSSRSFSPNSLGYHLGQILYGFQPGKPFIIDNSGYVKGNLEDQDLATEFKKAE